MKFDAMVLSNLSVFGCYGYNRLKELNDKMFADAGSPHEPEEHVCKVCGKQFNNSEDLFEHYDD